jgi:tRNA nucleotidyltransferase (CCA-adding enzyme)
MVIPDYTAAILQRLEDGGFPSYIVGGCVRDILLGINPKDYDVATSARPGEVLALFAGYKTVTAGLKHGTVGVVTGGAVTEITTFRSDGEYTDHRRPDTVSFSDSVEDDLARRDFTVNAMAYSPTRGIVDPFGGMRDLREGILRAVGDPAVRFSEDALRILRGVRFASVYGFEPEPATARAMTLYAPLLREISAERICAELYGALRGAYAEKYVYMFREAYAPVLPELTAMADRPNAARGDMLRRSLAAAAAAGEPVWLTLAALFEHVDPRGRAESAQVASDILFRLKTDRLTRENAVRLIREPEPDDLSRPGLRRLIARLTPKLAMALLRLRSASVAAAGDDGAAEKFTWALLLADDILVAGDCISRKMMELDGDDLVALGVPPGKKLGALLETLFCEVLDGRLENSKHALAARALELISSDAQKQEAAE